MRQVIKPGQPVDFLTPDEMMHLIPRPAEESRVRAAVSIQLDANGNGQAEAYNVPAGYEFEARRVVLDIGGSTDPSTGNVALNVAGKFVRYLRSGNPIEYAVPAAPTGTAQVPGVQTWSREQGPYLRNKETFEIQAKGLTANAVLRADVEGVLIRPSVP